MPAAVLVVEDDRELRDVVRRYLERVGYLVHTTGSGADAISLLDTGGLDLVVLDLRLPELTEERFIANPFADGGPSRLYGSGDLVTPFPAGTCSTSAAPTRR